MWNCVLCGRTNLRVSREPLLDFLSKVLNPQMKVTLGKRICQMKKCKYKCLNQTAGGFTDQYVMINMLYLNDQHFSFLRGNVLFKAKQKLTVALVQRRHKNIASVCLFHFLPSHPFCLHARLVYYVLLLSLNSI